MGSGGGGGISLRKWVHSLRLLFLLEPFLRIMLSDACLFINFLLVQALKSRDDTWGGGGSTADEEVFGPSGGAAAWAEDAMFT